MTPKTIEQASPDVREVLRVTRYCIGGADRNRPGPDYIKVEDAHGVVLVDERMGPEGPFRPATVDEARARPWFFTGSPFGREIVASLHAKGPGHEQ